ncbi:MAG: molybdopterin cofactor-binding domain-containing protein [Caulobacteraceae bacterium]
MTAHTSRRDFLRAMGALVVAASAPAPGLAAAAKTAGGALAKSMDPAEIDAWLAVSPDGMVTAFFGKPDVGQGVEVAIAQIVAEEMDLPVERVQVHLADTGMTCDQGGVSGSTGVQRGGATLRNIAAEARRLLVERAADELKVPADQLKVDNGVVSAPGGGKRTYAQLVEAAFKAKLDWNGQYGNGLSAKGKAKPKAPKDYKVVGTSPKRRDIPDKVFGKYRYSADVRLPGMLHGRAVRPPVAGAKVVAVDEASIAAIPGARVVRKGDFVGVVAQKEWNAIQAARLLKIIWSDARPSLIDSETLFDHIRTTEPEKRQVVTEASGVDQAMANGGTQVSAEYQWPFQSHASMGPACAVADVRPDSVTLYNPSQKTHATAAGVAKLIGRPVESVRSIYVQGPGSYGRNDAGDACADAALMSLLAGKPVRAQGMRADGHGWDPKGAASIHVVRATVSDSGRIVGHDFLSKGFTRMEVNTFEQEPQDFLAGQQTGFANHPVPGFGAPEDAYDFPARRVAWETIPRLLDAASPLRTSHLRDPLGPQLHFASESFIDECALAANADPVAFRLAHISNARHRAVIEAAAKAAGWKAGPPDARRQAADGKAIGPISRGMGFAYAPRGETIVAMACEVEVDRATGRIWPRRFWVAHECGLIVNPGTLKSVIEGNVVHGASRALFEEVTFDARNVTSVDWVRYPILEMDDAPDAVEIVLIDRPDLPPSGAGEPSTRPVAAAIANAVFDATGVRLRRAPFTRARMKAGLATV